MRRLTIIFCAFFLAFQAHATFVEQPPARYTGPFPGETRIVETDYAGIYEACKPLLGVYACAGVDNGACVIHILFPGLMNRSLSPADRVKARVELLAHETGHCNGWPADHPR